MKEGEERWVEFEACTVEDDDKEPHFDIFGDPDPYEDFSFNFKVSKRLNNAQEDNESNKKTDITDGKDGYNEENNEKDNEEEKREISIVIKGFKHEHERIFDSTGLTLWRASKLLCDYMCSNPQCIENKRVLEIGAGLGLCGLLAYHLHASSVVMTDGDTDVLTEMRYNVDQHLINDMERNKRDENDATSTTSMNKPSDVIIPCRQLLWGKKHIDSFKKYIVDNMNNDDGSFDIIIASDVIYVEYILDDLFETIVGMLSPSQDSKFILAYARRAVDISLVFECATKHGLIWIAPDETEGVYIFSRDEKVSD